jgi:glycerate dehydrogenase
MLEMIRHVALHSDAVHAGQWTSCADWCFALKPITELTGKVLGIVGLGRIGLAFARICAAMGMRIIAHDEYQMSAEQLGGVAVLYVDMDDVFRKADVVSLHCPLTPKTDRLVGATRLGLMKPTAVLINTSRGPLIDNQALADALRAGTITAAAVDVLDAEPPPADNPLIGAPNCIITPHISWYATESRQRLMDIAVDNLKAFIAGKPVNQVN